MKKKLKLLAFALIPFMLGGCKEEAVPENNTPSTNEGETNVETPPEPDIEIKIGEIYKSNTWDKKINKMAEREVDGHNARQVSSVSSQRSAIRGDTSRINPTGLARIKHRLSTYVGLGADGAVGDVGIHADHAAREGLQRLRVEILLHDPGIGIGCRFNHDRIAPYTLNNLVEGGGEILRGFLTDHVS